MKLDVIGLVRFVVAVRVKYGTAPALLFACVIRANWHDAHVGAPASYVFRGGEDVGLVFLPGATVEPAAYAPLLKRVAEEARATVILARPAFRSPVLFGGAKAFRALAASDPDVRTWVVGGHSVRFLRPSSSQPRRRRDPPPRANATERLVNLAGCLAKDCDNAEYSRLVRALCDEGGVNLVMVDEGKQLGEWAGLCKIDQDGEPKGVVRCSAACVTEFGEDTHALSVLLNYLKSQAPEES